MVHREKRVETMQAKKRRKANVVYLSNLILAAFFSVPMISEHDLKRLSRLFPRVVWVPLKLLDCLVYCV